MIVLLVFFFKRVYFLCGEYVWNDGFIGLDNLYSKFFLEFRYEFGDILILGLFVR